MRAVTLPRLLTPALFVVMAAGLWPLAAIAREAEPETISLLQDGVKRTALVQAPVRRAGSRLPAIVIVLHGGGRTARDVFETMSWPRIAAREGFLLAAPQGLNNQWNDGRQDTLSGKRSDADDVAFLRRLAQRLLRDYGADPGAIFITGVSNGGMMTMRLACERPGEITAAAPVIATMPEVMAANCRAAPPIPAMFIAGTADQLIRYDGAPSKALARRAQAAPMLSMDQTVSLWRGRNGCAIPPAVQELPDIVKRDNSSVTRFDYTGCASGKPVILLRINGGGHQQPGARPGKAQGVVSRLLGPRNADIDGPETIWAFFASRR